MGYLAPINSLQQTERGALYSEAAERSAFETRFGSRQWGFTQAYGDNNWRQLAATHAIVFASVPRLGVSLNSIRNDIP